MDAFRARVGEGTWEVAASIDIHKLTIISSHTVWLGYGPGYETTINYVGNVPRTIVKWSKTKEGHLTAWQMYPWGNCHNFILIDAYVNGG